MGKFKLIEEINSNNIHDYQYRFRRYYGNYIKELDYYNGDYININQYNYINIPYYFLENQNKYLFIEHKDDLINSYQITIIDKEWALTNINNLGIDKEFYRFIKCQLIKERLYGKS